MTAELVSLVSRPPSRDAEAANALMFQVLARLLVEKLRRPRFEQQLRADLRKALREYLHEPQARRLVLALLDALGEARTLAKLLADLEHLEGLVEDLLDDDVFYMMYVEDQYHLIMLYSRTFMHRGRLR